jgi:hypothetical protein
VRVTIGSGAELCVLTVSALNPKIKIETARKIMDIDLGRVFIILDPNQKWQIEMIRL